MGVYRSRGRRSFNWKKVTPSSIKEVNGHYDLLGEEGILRKIVDGGVPRSVIIWGPAGCGKTTMSRLYAKEFSSMPISCKFHSKSNALKFASVMKKVEEDLKKKKGDGYTVLFLDEIHLLHQEDQKLLVSYLENKSFILVAATICKPQRILIPEILEKDIVECRVYNLDDEALGGVLSRCEKRYKYLSTMTVEGRELLLNKSDGCGRSLIRMIELMHVKIPAAERKNETSVMFPLTRDKVEELITIRAEELRSIRKYALSDLKKGIVKYDCHYALGMLAYLFEIGVDPKEIMAKLVRISVEDVGVCDRDAFAYIKSACRAYYKTIPEKRDIALIKAVAYLSEAPKNRDYHYGYIREGDEFFVNFFDREMYIQKRLSYRPFYSSMEKKFKEKIRYAKKWFPKIQRQIRKEMKRENMVVAVQDCSI